MTRVGGALGAILAWRTRGREYIELVRVWVLPVIGTSSGAKYLFGLEGWWALAAGIAIPIALEGGATVAGWLDMRSGAGRAHQDALNRLDPYKDQTLRLLTEIRDASRDRERAIASVLQRWSAEPSR